MISDARIDLIMPLLGGLLGSGHCLGMCGGFVMTVGAAAERRRILRQIVYALGRVSVYAFAGAVAGFAGWRAGLSTESLVNLQAWLCLGAGAMLALEGCWSLGWLPRWSGPTAACPMASLGSLLRAPHLSSVFAAGIWNGFLPCGLVYAYLALAASTNDMFRGLTVMSAFGLGTIPALAIVGWSGSMLSLTWRRRIFRIAAVCLLLTGVWTVYRGAAILTSPSRDADPGCPLCESTDTAQHPR